MEYSQEIINALTEVNAEAAELNGAAINGFTHKELFDRSVQLYGAVGELIETLEDQDENMDPEKTKLPNLDEVFSGDPASDYVDALINLAQGSGKLDDVIAAGQRLADFQNGVETPEPEEEKKKYDKSINGFIEAVSDSLGLESDRAEDFKKQMSQAIEMMKSRPGANVQFVGYHKDEVLKGAMHFKGSVLTLSINGEDYVYNEADFAKEEEPQKPYKGFCCDYPEEPVVDEEELFNTKQSMELNLADYVTAFGFGKYEPNELLDVIQSILDRRVSNFTKDDYKLLRFYLKQKPFNDPEEIDTLSERALELAWKRFKYMRILK